MKRTCLNCAHCDIYELFGIKRMRCGYHPDIVDHSFAAPLEKVKDYVCENHETEEEEKKRVQDDTWDEYIRLKERIRGIEEKYPQFKDREE